MNVVPHSFNELVLALAIPESVLGILSSYPYAIVFVGLLLGGETVLLPALYFAVIGVLNGWYIMAIMILATVISDGFWYALGRGAIFLSLRSSMNEKRTLQLDKLSRVIVGKELIILFYSKFIYGTRIAAQILCGARKVDVYPYLVVNTFAITVLGAVYYFAVRLSFIAVDSFDSFQYKSVAVMVLVVAVAATLHLLVYTLVKRKWYL